MSTIIRKVTDVQSYPLPSGSMWMRLRAGRNVYHVFTGGPQGAFSGVALFKETTKCDPQGIKVKTVNVSVTIPRVKHGALPSLLATKRSKATLEWTT